MKESFSQGKLKLFYLFSQRKKSAKKGRREKTRTEERNKSHILK